ncbi:pyridine nucleotide-disulfide oxidoreductase [Sulfodiicoccus acidiphilus]|uniref:Pyridine nucleotide-disulfide oxidoreductase n=1 Tax=Sulfodiicoccus acidiphilus TaxID=1670455 RepID=A0A348B0K3_9CREN|nr:NAD(P)/FAD-dependent oxidoreductase [Sulfodiicoccus acidiphilus]BBD71705.1 pyridine nucleotide-disulfide oxidoreductase [Sulfodiicoccus acidiphilus]GGT86472.1 pyridine nucleotide-disulfide oxidoreductase [Sulfodiicoccus acidiphilus]
MKSVVLGSGPAGVYAAVMLSRNSKVTLVDEKEKLGGTCVLYGCIPSKAMFHPFQLASGLRKFGLSRSISIEELQEVGREAADKVSKGVEYLLESYGVEIVRGKGKLSQNGMEVGTQTFPFDKAVIASGTSKPEVEGTVASDELPYINISGGKAVVIGGGAGGVEFAWFLSQCGMEVHIIESSDSLLQGGDPDISKAIKSNFLRRGIKLHLGVRALGSTKGKVILSDGTSIESDLTLFTFGRRPNSGGLGLELKGKYIKVNELMSTSREGVYAAGDVTGTFTAHEAIHQGIVAGLNATGVTTIYEGEVVPKVIYTKPEIATVGKMEGESVKVSYNSLSRALADGEVEGFLKVFHTKGRIVGATAYGERAEDLISIAGLAIKARMKVEDLFNYHFPHPSYMELLWEAAGKILGHFH